MRSLSPSETTELLLNVAPRRPVFIWGPPGIGKTAIVTQFGAALGFEVVSLLGSQLAPEDLIGVPRIEAQEGSHFSVFAPPRQIAGRKEPFILFIDEFNAAAPEVQKAFYSLITEQRLGEYQLPQGSIIILAGNRAQDNAITRAVSSALINRVLHIEMRANHRDWLKWAYEANLHYLVLKYIEIRPDHLSVAPPKTEEPFSTPRAWHILSDALYGYGDALDANAIALLAEGTLSPSHAHNFSGFARGMAGGLQIDEIISGKRALPSAPDERDLLTFVIAGIRAQLTKELPPAKDDLNAEQKERLHNTRRLIAEIARLDEELLMLLFAREEGDDARNWPSWFIADMVATLPRLAARLATESA